VRLFAHHTFCSGDVFSPSHVARAEWSSYNQTNKGDDDDAESIWQSARRRNNGGRSGTSSGSGTFNASTFFAAVRSGSLSSVSSVVDSNPTALFQVPPSCLLSAC
jgi:hypothetical protein